jgi:uncharacterized tellurite resistance protein B-like protein
MLNALRSLFASLAPSSRPDFEATDPRVAAAALLVHAIAVDGVVSERERRVLLGVLGRRFSLGEAEAAALLKEAKARDDEAVDLYGFTSRLKRELDEDGRRRVVEMLWEVVYADGTVHEFEDNLVWRIAELLGVSPRERLDMRRKIAGSADGGER